MQLISMQENQGYFGRRRYTTTLQQAPNQMDTHSRETTSVGRVVRRLVSFVKNILTKILGTALLTQTEFHTILKEGSRSLVNNRPQTYVESDTTPTSATALTPSHLIN